jgi:DNA-binding MarR family transcriptional regulator
MLKAHVMQECASTPEVESLKRLLVELGRMRSFRDPLSGVGSPELTSLQAHAVLWLGHDGPLSMGVLAQRIGSPVPAATGVVDRLEKLGFISRDRTSEDRRVVQVALTETGMTLYRDIDQSICEGLGQFLTVLPRDDRTALLSILERLVGSLGGESPREPAAGDPSLCEGSS